MLRPRPHVHASDTMSRAALTAGARWTAAAALLLASAGSMTHARAESGALHVRTSEAFAPCLAPVVQAFSRESGLGVIVDIGDLDPPRSADVLIGDDSEMTRLLEGGIAELETSFPSTCIWISITST